MNLPLARRSILVTRPAAQSAGLAKSIRDTGGQAVIFPAIEIQPVVSDELTRQIDQLPTFNAAIFISPNAAQYGVAAVRARREFPTPLSVYALGPGTARELARHGLPDAIQPEGADSEALLALPSLQKLAGQRIIIFRGIGGRELLAETLKARGAHVEYAESYARVCPQADAAPLVQQWANGGIHAVTITSAEALHNLAALLGNGGANYLRATPVFAPHEKIAEAARQFAITQVITTASGDAGLLSGLIIWFNTHV
jgi:uroporphyrinogen-III synthase